MIPRSVRCLLAATGIIAATAPLRAQQGGAVDWPSYGNGALGGRYSPLADINRDNVAGLRVLWVYHTGETDSAWSTMRPTSFEATPLVVDATLYLSTALGRVIALDPATGRERWVFDPRVDRETHFGDFTSRGVSTWVDPAVPVDAPCHRRILVATVDTRLIALDARTGQPCAGFGAAGTVDLKQGLRNPPLDAAEYEETSPPAVINGIVVVGSAVADNNRTDAASGEVRGYDARTGRLRWTWYPVPVDSSDAGWRTWIGPRAHQTGAANAWPVIAADSARDLVIVPTGSASPDYFGGERLGQNLYANSVVALRASTGRLVWSFQTVHHDLWDYDNASPPALVSIRHDGRERDIVLQATKTGQLFVLDRDSGKPLFPVEERVVPRSTVPGEEAWPTQPLSALSLSPLAISADQAWGLDSAERSACHARMAALRYEGVFTPPSLQGSLVLPSNIGGAHWGGVAFDPVRQIAVVPVNTIAAEVQLIPREEYESRGGWKADPEWIRRTSEYTDMKGTPYVMRRSMILSPMGRPCTPPPFGLLVAVNLATGRIAWQVPLGEPTALAGAGTTLPPGLGSPNLGGAIVTAGGLVFIAATLDHTFRAYDIESGRELWKADLPAGGKATPMTYRLADGRQVVVIAAGGDGKVFGRGDAVVAYTR